MNAYEFSGTIGNNKVNINEVSGISKFSEGIDALAASTTTLSQLNGHAQSIVSATKPITDIYSAAQDTISNLDSLVGDRRLIITTSGGEYIWPQ